MQRKWLDVNMWTIMISLPSFTRLTRALVLVINRCWVATGSSPCLLAVTVAPWPDGPGGPGAVDNASRVVIRIWEVGWAAVLLQCLVSRAICPTIGCWWIVAVPCLGFQTGRLSILLVAARTPCRPASPITINWGIIGFHLQQKRM